jgi:hypothetical protein
MKASTCLILLIALIGQVGAGCQTFNLSEEDFAKQQRGGSIDPDVGDWVGIAGTAGYLGAATGSAAASIK